MEIIRTFLLQGKSDKNVLLHLTFIHRRPIYSILYIDTRICLDFYLTQILWWKYSLQIDEVFFCHRTLS